MAFFGVHVVLPHGCDYVQFAPGDEVPDWAVELVGEHCLAADSELPEPDDSEDPDREPQPPADNEHVAEGAEKFPKAPPAGPDFTAPAKPVRGRPRKS